MPSAVIAPAIVVPGANGARGWIGVTFAAPPPSAAGLVQSTSWPAGALRPKIASAGGVSPKVENAITQPGCERERQARVCFEAPPTSLPFLTGTVPPRKTPASLFFRRFG